MSSAIVRPVGLCDDGTSKPTHFVLSRDEYLGLVRIRDKWLREMLQQPEFAAELIGPHSSA